MTLYHNKELTYNNNQYQVWFWDIDECGCAIFWHNGRDYVNVPENLQEDAFYIRQNFLKLLFGDD